MKSQQRDRSETPEENTVLGSFSNSSETRAADGLNKEFILL